MLFWVRYSLQRLRQRRGQGLGIVFALVTIAFLGNSLCFLYFDGQVKPELTFADGLWYTLVSITTIGYGDLSAQTPGARLGMAFFVVGIGLTSFTSLLGLLVDRVMQANFKEAHGLSDIHSKDHILLINFPDATRVARIIDELRRDKDYEDRDIIVITDTIETLPWDRANVFFVKGSPLQADTLTRAGVKRAALAIVLADSNNPASDGIVASIINLIEHLQCKVKTVAECLDSSHDILFQATQCDSIVYTHKVLNNLLVQEVQDTGVAAVLSSLTSNQSASGFYACQVTGLPQVPYTELALKLATKGNRLIAVTRDGFHHVNVDGLISEIGDLIVYIGNSRHPWPQLLNNH